MKKAVLLMLSLFSALSLMFLSCSTDSSGGGSDPEFDVTICDSSLKERLIWERDSGKEVYIFVTSNNYLKDLKIKNVYDEELKSIEFKVDDTIDVDEFRLYKVYLTGIPSEAGTYQYRLSVCSESNSNKKKTIDFTVKITGSSSGSETESAVPVIKTQPVAGKKYYEADETIEPLTVKAEISSGDITYQWYKDGNPISGANGASCSPTEKGEYYVVVSNSSDSTKYVKSNVVSIVILAEGELVPPTITTDLEDSVSYDKSSMIEEIKVEAKTDNGTVNYQWYDNNNGVVIGETSASYKPTAFGSYYCKLWTVDGDKKSQEVISNTITIKESEISITINGLDKEAYLGDTLTVSVVTNVDTDSVTYQWINTHGGVSSGNDEPITGATSDSYKPEAEGYYTCRVTVKSKGGEEKSSTNGGICHVKEQEEGDAEKPVISAQPKDVSCKEGGTITLTVKVETPADGGELSYQWKKDGQSISGATNATYTKTDVTTEDAGSYTVDVKNTLSTGKSATTTSSAAKVSVSGGTGNIDGGTFQF